MNPFVVVTQEQVIADTVLYGETEPLEYVANLFKREHGLTFEPKQLESSEFIGHISDCQEAFRVTYIGNLEAIGVVH